MEEFVRNLVASLIFNSGFLGGVLVLLAQAVVRRTTDRVQQRQALLYKVSHSKLLSMEELGRLAKSLKLTFGHKRVDELYLSSIHFRNAGIASIDKYPISVRFGSGTRILQTDWQVTQNIDYDPLIEDNEATRLEQRAYFVNLMPKDVLVLDFLSSGKNVAAPTVSPRQELLASINQITILDREDKVQTSQGIIDASIIFGRTVILFLIVGGSFILSGWLRDQGATVSINDLVLGAGIMGSLGYLVFRLQVWREQFSKAFGKNKVIELSDTTRDFSLKIIRIYAVAAVIFVVIEIAFWYSGHGDWSWEILSLIAEKLGKLINALIH